MNNIANARRSLWIEGYGSVGMLLCSLLYVRIHSYYWAIPYFILSMVYAYLWIKEYKKYKYLIKM